MKNKRRRGFTLVEVLTSLAIAGIALSTLAALIAGAFQVIRVLDSRKKATLENALIALDKMAKEMQESPVVAPLPFTGTAGSVSFPRILSRAGGNTLNAEFRLGQVQRMSLAGGFDARSVIYSYDASQKAFSRRVEGEEPVVLAENLGNVVFSYAVASGSGGAVQWKESTPAAGSKERLMAVSVRAEFDPKVCRYSIPAVEKVFFVIRAHPLNALDEKIQQVGA